MLHVRLPRRLLDSYRWTAPDADELTAATEPIVAIRQIEPGESESTIAHLRLPAPDALPILEATSSDGAALMSVAAASCFIDTDWTSTWLAALRAEGPLVVLIDIEAARFVGS